MGQDAGRMGIVVGLGMPNSNLIYTVEMLFMDGFGWIIEMKIWLDHRNENR